MEKSREILKKANIYPRLRLGEKLDGGGVKATGAHTVKLLEEHIVKGIDPKDGKEKHYMRFIVEDMDGVKRRYDTRLTDDAGQPSYLIQELAEYEAGDIVTLEMKKAGAKNYISVNGEANAMDTKPEEIDTDEDN